MELLKLRATAIAFCMFLLFVMINTKTCPYSKNRNACAFSFLTVKMCTHKYHVWQATNNNRSMSKSRTFERSTREARPARFYQKCRLQP